MSVSSRPAARVPLSTTLALLACASFPAAETAAADPAIQQLQEQLALLKDQVDDLAQQQKSNANGQRLQIKGFADVQYRASQTDQEDDTRSRSNSFAMGQFDLFMTAAIADHISFMAETVIEVNEENGIAIDLERLLINYDLSPSLRLSAGRYHSTIGYWNDAFHHGEWLSTSIGRPQVVEFEDGHGLLPSHNVGLQAKGDHDVAGILKLDGTLEIGNGRGKVPDPPQLQNDANQAKCVNLQLGISPYALLSGLRIGGGVYLDRIPDNTPTIDAAFPDHGEMREIILTGFAVYRQGPWDLLAEYYRIIHTTTDDGTPGLANGTQAVSNAGIVQLGYRLGTWTPYVRGDVAQVSELDRYYDSTDQTATLGIGLRWDACSWNAIKIQVQHTRITAGQAANPASSAQDATENAVLLQTAVSF